MVGSCSGGGCAGGAGGNTVPVKQEAAVTLRMLCSICLIKANILAYCNKSISISHPMFTQKTVHIRANSAPIVVAL